MNRKIALLLSGMLSLTVLFGITKPIQVNAEEKVTEITSDTIYLKVGEAFEMSAPSLDKYITNYDLNRGDTEEGTWHGWSWYDPEVDTLNKCVVDSNSLEYVFQMGYYDFETDELVGELQYATAAEWSKIWSDSWNENGYIEYQGHNVIPSASVGANFLRALKPGTTIVTIPNYPVGDLSDGFTEDETIIVHIPVVISDNATVPEPPTTPQTPSTPEAPASPQTPATPQTPTTPQTTTTPVTTNTTIKSPQTGDSSFPIILSTGTILLSLLGIGCLKFINNK